MRYRNELSDQWRSEIDAGIAWLQNHQNDDGGFGDTDRSHSNIATSYLVLAASTLATECGRPGLSQQSRDDLQEWLDTAGGLPALRARYGTDQTFVVPILTNMAIAGLVPWTEVAQLPFEAAVLPQSWYRFVGLPVVSYAIPALVAIGQARFFAGHHAWSPISWLRRATVRRTLATLLRMQPSSGGYLEATPLTAFVTMALASSGRGDHPVALAGLRFLKDSQREEGAWPIDTNLATWVTSLAVNALRADPEDDRAWCTDTWRSWHLRCQHRQQHAFTGAQPGGWGWTDLSGAVPDADDTPAALIAIMASETADAADCRQACEQGADWLLRLQNRDGGWPTFCRGWGTLPFDRSSTDLTAHALRALRGFRIWTRGGSDRRIERAMNRGAAFLAEKQREDGAWLPLWFGNQDNPDDENPIYGTSRVLLDAGGVLSPNAIASGTEHLLRSQNPDGGWGGGASLTGQNAASEHASSLKLPPTSSVEESALALEALASLHDSLPADLRNPTRLAILRGVRWLTESVADGRHRTAWPIGFYFAKLWYYEDLYPLIFACAALGRVLQHEPHLR
ncbi:MAG: prenyltransferase/squalene oxidase repeat-containing protein [Planctomycetota bacterium]